MLVTTLMIRKERVLVCRDVFCGSFCYAGCLSLPPLYGRKIECFALNLVSVDNPHFTFLEVVEGTCVGRSTENGFPSLLDCPLCGCPHNPTIAFVNNKRRPLALSKDQLIGKLDWI